MLYKIVARARLTRTGRTKPELEGAKYKGVNANNVIIRIKITCLAIPIFARYAEGDFLSILGPRNIYIFSNYPD